MIEIGERKKLLKQRKQGLPTIQVVALLSASLGSFPNLDGSVAEAASDLQNPETQRRAYTGSCNQQLG